MGHVEKLGEEAERTANGKVCGGGKHVFSGIKEGQHGCRQVTRDSGMRRAGRGTQGLESRVGNLHRAPLKDLSRGVAWSGSHFKRYLPEVGTVEAGDQV